MIELQSRQFLKVANVFGIIADTPPGGGATVPRHTSCACTSASTPGAVVPLGQQYPWGASTCRLCTLLESCRRAYVNSDTLTCNAVSYRFRDIYGQMATIGVWVKNGRPKPLSWPHICWTLEISPANWERIVLGGHSCPSCKLWRWSPRYMPGHTQNTQPPDAIYD